MRLAFVFDNHILQHEPLGPMYIASHVRQLGHVVEYFNADDAGFGDELRAFAPEVLAYSIATGQQVRFFELNRALRRALPTAQLSLFGGPHPTFFPEMIHVDGVDAICVGEGELPTGELLDALARGRDWTRIPNLHVKLPDGTVVKNRPRDFLPHLDELPLPDHDIKLRFPHLRDRKIGFFIMGRGCPFHCTFCFNDAMMALQGGKYVRFRDPEKVCEEIALVRDRHGIRLVSFQDDIFGIDVKWMEKFAPLYRERVGLPFMCHYRADMATERSMRALYEAGCNRLIIGLESGDEDLRQRVMDKRVTTAELLACARMAQEHGIELLTQNMFGIPGETVETALSTVALNIRIRPEVFIHYFFVPYPMTKLGEIAQEMGLFDGDFDALPISYHNEIPLNIPHKGVIRWIGVNSYFFIDMPLFFWLTKGAFRVLRGDRARVAWLRVMHRIGMTLHALGLRRRTCWYHDPSPEWRWADGRTPQNTPLPEARRRRRRCRVPLDSAFGVAPNLSELKKA